MQLPVKVKMGGRLLPANTYNFKGISDHCLMGIWIFFLTMQLPDSQKPYFPVNQFYKNL